MVLTHADKEKLAELEVLLGGGTHEPIELFGGPLDGAVVALTDERRSFVRSQVMYTYSLGFDMHDTRKYIYEGLNLT